MDLDKSSLLRLVYLLQYLLVRVVRLYKLVLADPAAQADDIRHLILLLGQSLGDHLVSFLPVTFLLPPIQCECIMKDDCCILSVLLSVRDCLQVLNQLHHFVIVLDLPEQGLNNCKLGFI